MTLVTVEVRSQLGAVYSFPDMDSSTLAPLLDGMRNPSSTQLTLVNVSGAALCIPVRIVAAVLVDGEERWTASPACTASNP